MTDFVTRDERTQTEPISLLMRFEGIDDDVVTFLDSLPPFGVLQVARVTWEAAGEPDEVLVTVRGVGDRA